MTESENTQRVRHKFVFMSTTFHNEMTPSSDPEMFNPMAEDCFTNAANKRFGEGNWRADNFKWSDSPQKNDGYYEDEEGHRIEYEFFEWMGSVDIWGPDDSARVNRDSEESSSAG